MKLKSSFFKTALATLVICSAQFASASPLLLTLKNGGGSVIDTFSLESTAGQADGAGTPYVLYTILNDLLGYDGVFFGDATTGGWFGIGNVSGSIVNQVISEHFTPALYSGSGLVANLTVGASYVSTSGDVLEVSGVPEPESLALFGLALAGLALVRRRKS